MIDLKEIVLLEKLKDEIEIISTEKEDVAPFILKHYLGGWPNNIKKIYGIRLVGQGLIGMIIYGYPMVSATKVIQPEVQSKEVLEIKRLFIEDIDDLPHVESYVIAKSLKIIKQEFPEIKVVLTFADEKAGHMGSIYQATNAIYLGKSGGKHKYAYILRGNLNAIKNLLGNKSYPKK